MLEKIKKSLKEKRESPWLYLIITFFLTWLFMLPAALINKDIGATVVIILIILSGIFGKLIPPILLPYLMYGKDGWRDYWQRLVDYKRLGIKWGITSLVFPILFIFLGVITSLFFGGKFPSFEMTNVLKIIPYAFFILLYGPLPEEMGWTGYELDRLQAKFNALNSAIILGVFWLMWHFPLFFIEGSYQQQVIGFNTMRFWLTFVPGILCLQILQVWIYNNTNRSTLSAVLIHFMTNFSGEMLNLSVMQEYFRSMWTILITIVIVIYWGHKNLAASNKITNFDKIITKRDGM